jgi:hypothetical protein
LGLTLQEFNGILSVSRRVPGYMPLARDVLAKRPPASLTFCKPYVRWLRAVLSERLKTGVSRGHVMLA